MNKRGVVGPPLKYILIGVLIIFAFIIIWTIWSEPSGELKIRSENIGQEISNKAIEFTYFPGATGRTRDPIATFNYIDLKHPDGGKVGVFDGWTYAKDSSADYDLENQEKVWWCGVKFSCDKPPFSYFNPDIYDEGKCDETTSPPCYMKAGIAYFSFIEVNR